MADNKCDTCLERRKPYPKNLPKESGSEGGIWSFFSAKPKESGCGCGGGAPPPAKDTSGDAGCGCKGSAKDFAAAAANKLKNPDSCDSVGSKAESQKPDECACEEPEEDCASKREPIGSGAMPGSPMPSTVPALILPLWFQCPPSISIPPFQTPQGENIRPISEGGRNHKCEGGQCEKCGQSKPPAGAPKVNANCPMVKNKTCPTAGGKDKAEGAPKPSFLAKCMAMFGMGKK